MTRILSFVLLGCALLMATVSPVASRAGESDRLVVCGWDEVFVIDVSDAERGEIKKLWSWRAASSEGLPESMRKRFGTTDECKPLADGSVLIASSGGACAVIERATGNTLWHATVANAHSIESLPGRRIVAAASTAAEGNRVILFDRSQPEKRLWEDELHSAHGVVWDEERQSLWALGFDELRRYEPVEWESTSPTLKLVQTIETPDAGGHDLQAVPKSDDLILSTHAGVWHFDRKSGGFRADEALGRSPHVKCVSHHPTDGRVAVVQASEGTWWTDAIQLREPEGKVVLPGEKIYKVRWLVEPAADARD